MQQRQLAGWKYRTFMRDYLATVAAIDESMGRVLHYLDSTGLARNTIVVYTSDQGFYLGEHGWYDKRFMYEPSFRMPLLVRYPGVVPAGSVNDDLVLNLDFAPTFLDLAGANVPPPVQGRSLRPLLTGRTPGNWRDAVYYHYLEYPHGWHSVQTHYGVRTGRYKLIRFYGDGDWYELYDLERDPHELTNVFDEPEYRAVQMQLLEKLGALRRQYDDPDGPAVR